MPATVQHPDFPSTEKRRKRKWTEFFFFSFRGGLEGEGETEKKRRKKKPCRDGKETVPLRSSYTATDTKEIKKRNLDGVDQEKKID